MGWQWFWKKTADQASQGQSNKEQPTLNQNSYYKQYSSERSCVPDQEDQNFLQCTQKIIDGNNTYEKKERVPANEGFNSRRSFSASSSLFGTGNNQFENVFQDRFNHGNFQKQFEEFDHIFMNFLNNPIFGMNRPFGSSFSTPPQFRQPQHPQGYRTSQYQNQNQMPKKGPQSKEKKYYFSHKYEKDYNIKDL